MEYAGEESLRTGSLGISPDHLMLGLIRHRNNAAVQTLESLGVDSDDFKKELDRSLISSESIPWSKHGEVRLTRNSRNILDIAVLESLKSGRRAVEAIHILAAIASSAGTHSGRYLKDKGVDKNMILSRFGKEEAVRRNAGAGHRPEMKDIAGALAEQIRKSIKLCGEDSGSMPS